ncbi:WXG100 family type VII secretion target [Actinoplanes sp. NPDC051859]|uniref:WXG100 family type VII secretion target n=1 Tax=Actinoplanes sp. NPDC051859 TaxID=3363909 RepID=UPI00378FD19C
MGQPTIQTTDEGMQAAIELFGGKYGEFTAYGRNIDDEVAALLVVFRGRQADTFRNAMTAWEQSFNKITSQLNGLIDSMGGNANDYIQIEDSGVQAGTNFLQSLPGFD